LVYHGYRAVVQGKGFEAFVACSLP
jgi:hypothetical protein